MTIDIQFHIPLSFICKLNFNSSNCTEVNGFFCWVHSLFVVWGFLVLGFFVLFVFKRGHIRYMPFCYLFFQHQSRSPLILYLLANWCVNLPCHLRYVWVWSQMSNFFTERSFSEGWHREPISPLKADAAVASKIMPVYIAEQVLTKSVLFKAKDSWFGFFASNRIK